MKQVVEALDILSDDELLDIYLKAESKDDDWAGIRAIAQAQDEQTKKAEREKAEFIRRYLQHFINYIRACISAERWAKVHHRSYHDLGQYHSYIDYMMRQDSITKEQYERYEKEITSFDKATKYLTDLTEKALKESTKESGGD